MSEINEKYRYFAESPKTRTKPKYFVIKSKIFVTEQKIYVSDLTSENPRINT